MKKFVIAAMIAAGVAMCAAVWPHGKVPSRFMRKIVCRLG